MVRPACATYYVSDKSYYATVNLASKLHFSDIESSGFCSQTFQSGWLLEARCSRAFGFRSQMHLLAGAIGFRSRSFRLLKPNAPERLAL